MSVDDAALPALKSDQDVWEQDVWEQGMADVQECMEVPQEWPRGPMQCQVAVPAQRSRHYPQSPRQRSMCRASMSVSWQKCSRSDDSTPDISHHTTLATESL